MDRHLYIFCILPLLWLCQVQCKQKSRKFPKGFKFGVATSAYQTEGSWDKDGKGESIWDVATHQKPSLIKDQSDGDVATDSYNQYKHDIEMMKDLGVNIYKFSLSWPRVLPNGFSYKVNEDGVKYYATLIDELFKNNIEPFVTMYHWDLPIHIQKVGGWTNPYTITWFVDYAKVLFDKFGDKIRYWITINDPHQICAGYGSAKFAPFVKLEGIGEYLCAKNIILAHARVYRLYEDYRKFFNGSIGIALSANWYEPASHSSDDMSASYDAMMFEWGIYAHPLFTNFGNYPVEVRRNVATKSAEQGFARSRLPPLTTEEKTEVRKSVDFLGINHFTTKLVYRDPSLEGMYPVPSYADDTSAVISKDPSWIQSKSSWLQEVPMGFLKLLKQLSKIYSNPPIFITGNGWSTAGGLLDDGRIRYIRNYLTSVLDAVEDGCNVKGYMYWSLLDNFEWKEGYTEKFGLAHVHFSSPERARTPRKSYYVYKQIIQGRALDLNFEPKYEVTQDQKIKEKDENDVF